MNILIIVIAIIVVAFVILLYLGNFAFNLALERGDEKTMQRLPGRPQEYPNNDWIKNNTQKVTITSDDGLELCAYLYDGDTKKFAVLCHGYRNDHYMLDLPAQKFAEMGFGVLSVDARGHGDSEGKYICMGWYERRDIIKWCEMLRSRFGNDIRIVLYGVSMGAATVMMTGGEEDVPENVRCIVEDCGFTSLWDQSAHLLKVFYSLPPFPVLYSINMVCKRKAHYTLKEVSPLEQLKKCRVPVLFIHGVKDNFVPYYMRDVLYDAAAGPKEKLDFAKAAHAQSFKTEPDRYFASIKTFTDKYC